METLETLFNSFEIGLRMPKATKPKAYLKTLGLDYSDLRIGFNSGQFVYSINYLTTSKAIYSNKKKLLRLDFKDRFT